MSERKCLAKLVLWLCLPFSSLACDAFQVSVQSTSSEVAGIGYILNGTKYGKVGRAYTGKGMPVGLYIFGVRVGGILGTDVRCYTKAGKSTVKLMKDTNAILTYKDNQCKVNLD